MSSEPEYREDLTSAGDTKTAGSNMNMPPSLSARAMFWWGVGLLAAGIIVNQALAVSAGAYGSLGVATALQSFFGIGSLLGTAVFHLGIAAIVGSFVVRAVVGTQAVKTGPGPNRPHTDNSLRQ